MYVWMYVCYLDIRCTVGTDVIETIIKYQYQISRKWWLLLVAGWWLQRRNYLIWITNFELGIPTAV